MSALLKSCSKFRKRWMFCHPVLNQYDFATHLLSTSYGESLALEDTRGKVDN